ncbi:MAG TPA: acyltransferase, partial [Bradyrhizobium sp.]|nr:acyltransferase [Bradyrhizobium sp.]
MAESAAEAQVRRAAWRATGGIKAPAAAATGSFLTVQALRAVAALLVVAHHAFEMWEARITPDAPGPSWTNGASGVDIFFVISGFVMVIASRRILARPHAARIFMEHRVARIVPLYWLLTTAKLALVLLFSGLALRSTLDLDYVARSYLFLPLVDSAGHFRPLLPVGWTLTYEFLFYLLFALALGLRADVLRVLVPAFVIIVMLALLRSASWPAWTILFSTIVVEFLFGVLIAKATLRGFTLPPMLAALMVLAGFTLILTIPEGSENLRVLTWGLPAFA